jgi:Prealbumin-like fold domain
LHDVILTSCAPSVSVIKRILPYSEAPDPTDPGYLASAYVPPDRWSFAASSDDPVTITPPSGLTDPDTGGIAFDLDFAAGATPDISIAEDLSAPPWSRYTPLPTFTSCVNKSADDAPVPTAQDPAVPEEFTLPVGLEDAISCVVYNMAPANIDQASVAVHKRWRVTSETDVQDTPNGRQPSGLQSQLNLSGPASAELTTQGWSDERTGYDVSGAAPDYASTVTINEELNTADLPGCTVQDVTLEAGLPEDSTPGSGTPLPETDPTSTALPLVQGRNDWTITNAVTCASYLTLDKQVASGDGDPAWWTLDAIAPGDALPGPEGVSGTPEVTRVEVSPDVPYQLAETPDPAVHEALHYVQNDNRTEPLEYPGSTGSWACSPNPSVGNEGAVIVPLGAEYTCVVVNQTALLTVDKTVSGGDAAPGDFPFTITPLPPIIPGGHDHEVVPGEPRTIVPGQHYALTESGGPDGYTLTDLTCTSGSDPLDPADFAALPGASVECSATNTYGAWTAVKSSDPSSGSEVRPGDVITYTVTATQLVDGGVSPDARVVEDLTKVLNHATLVDGSITAPDGTTVEQTSDTLAWTIPTLTDTLQLTFQVRVDDGAWNVTLDNVLSELTGGQPCNTIADPPFPFPDPCDRTAHPTPDEPTPPGPPPPPEPPAPGPPAPPEQPTVPGLPITGAAVPPALLALAALLILSGATLRAAFRNRSGHPSD